MGALFATDRHAREHVPGRFVNVVLQVNAFSLVAHLVFEDDLRGLPNHQPGFDQAGNHVGVADHADRDGLLVLAVGVFGIPQPTVTAERKRVGFHAAGRWIQIAVCDLRAGRNVVLHSVNSEEALHSAQRAVRHLRGLDFPPNPQVLP